MGSSDSLEACFLALCAHFGLPTSAAAMWASVSGEAGQLSPHQFGQAAEKAGLATALAPLALGHIDASILPLVALLNDRAVVIVGRPDDGSFAVIDPLYGSRAVSVPMAELAGQYTGHSILVRPLWRAGLDDSDATGHRRHWFWGALARNWWTYVQVMIAAGTTNVLSLTTSVFIMVVYDRVLPNEAVESLMALTAGVVIAIVFDFLIRTLRAAFIDTAGQRADLVMGRQIFDHLLDMQMKSRRGSVGAFASTLREFETLREFFASASVAALVDLPFILLFVLVIHAIGGPLAAVPAIAVPVVLVVGAAIQPFLARCASEAFAEGRAKQGVLVETITGLETIKTTGAAPVMRQRWEDSITHQSGMGMRMRRISQFALNATAFAQQASQVAIIVYGVFLIGAGTISMGALIACVILGGRSLAPLAQLANIMTRINQARTSYRALDKLMSEPTEGPGQRRYVSRPHLNGKIEFRDVSFRYPDQAVNALERVSFVINPGERVAFLGRIGSGKSTVARLILGLYEPENGAVLIDDTDMRQIHPADLRHNIGCVLQDIWLFSGTVRQNIAIGTHAPTDDEILRAAQLSGVHDFISQNPRGYDLILAERGEGLSGGQRQSIALARALVGQRRIMLFDEPTSMMDMETEQAVLTRLASSMQGRTLAVITHRTSMLELVDRVIVLDRGQVVADGPKSILSGAPGRRSANAGGG